MNNKANPQRVLLPLKGPEALFPQYLIISLIRRSFLLLPALGYSPSILQTHPTLGPYFNRLPYPLHVSVPTNVPLWIILPYLLVIYLFSLSIFIPILIKDNFTTYADESSKTFWAQLVSWTPPSQMVLFCLPQSCSGLYITTNYNVHISTVSDYSSLIF